jgi:hypothetical protein
MNSFTNRFISDHLVSAIIFGWRACGKPVAADGPDFPESNFVRVERVEPVPLDSVGDELRYLESRGSK